MIQIESKVLVPFPGPEFCQLSDFISHSVRDFRKFKWASLSFLHFIVKLLLLIRAE